MKLVYLPQHISLSFSDVLALLLPPCTLCQSVEIWATRFLLMVTHLVALMGPSPSRSAPSGFPLSGNGLWFNRSADSWVREWLPVGNGYLAGNHIIRALFLSSHNRQAMLPGGTSIEVTQLNIESLWWGGPFTDPVSLVSNKIISICLCGPVSVI
jgi:hypothetical protein